MILNDGESATVVDDFKAFKARAKTLFSSLESDDIVLESTMQFEREFLLRNGQNIRFFAISDATIDDLSGLDDSRLSFFDSSIDSLTGQASFSNANGVASTYLSRKAIRISAPSSPRSKQLLPSWISPPSQTMKRFQDPLFNPERLTTTPSLAFIGCSTPAAA